MCTLWFASQFHLVIGINSIYLYLTFSHDSSYENIIFSYLLRFKTIVCFASLEGWSSQFAFSSSLLFNDGDNDELVWLDLPLSLFHIACLSIFC